MEMPFSSYVLEKKQQKCKVKFKLGENHAIEFCATNLPPLSDKWLQGSTIKSMWME